MPTFNPLPSYRVEDTRAQAEDTQSATDGLVTKDTNVHVFAFEVVRDLTEQGRKTCQAAGPDAVSKLVKALVVARTILRDTDDAEKQGDLAAEPMFKEYAAGRGETKSFLRLVVTRTPYRWWEGPSPQIPTEPTEESDGLRVLRAGQNTEPKGVAGCIAGCLRQGQDCVLVAIGPVSGNQALKGMAVAHGFMAEERKRLEFIPRTAKGRDEGAMNSTEFHIRIAEPPIHEQDAEQGRDECRVTQNTRIGSLAGCIAQRTCDFGYLRLKSSAGEAISVAMRAMACARKILLEGPRGREAQRGQHDLLVRPYYSQQTASYTFDIYRTSYSFGISVSGPDRPQSQVIRVDKDMTISAIVSQGREALQAEPGCILECRINAVERAVIVAVSTRKNEERRDGCSLDVMLIPQFVDEVKGGGMELILIRDAAQASAEQQYVDRYAQDRSR